jgi:NADH:ubiquinone oxidoreductase subunit 3 (subunit A)
LCSLSLVLLLTRLLFIVLSLESLFLLSWA